MSEESRPFIELLSSEARELINARARRRRFVAGETVWLEGDGGDSVIFVRSGLLRIERVTADGDRQVLTLAGAGDVVGELAALDGAARSANVVALEASDVDVVPGRDLHDVIDRCPDVALAIARRIADRQRALTDQLVEMSAGTAVSRTASRLVQLLPTDGSVGRVEVSVHLPQAELAAWAGLSREAIVKALRELRRAGIVETARERITVLDVAALRRAAGRD